MRVHYVRLARHLLRVQVMNDLQYRANFFIQLFHSVLAVIAAAAGVLLVYRHISELNGWSRMEMFVLLGVFTMVSGLLRMFVRPNLYRMATDINQGSLDFVLTKPVDAQLLLSIRQVDVWQGTNVLAGAGLVTAGVLGSSGRTGPVDLLLFALTAAVGLFILYCFLFSLVCTAFWLVDITEVVALFESVYEASRWPLTIYPSWLRYALTFVVPVGFAVTLPAEAVTARLSAAAAAVELCFAIAAFWFTRRFFHSGLRRYSGASA